MHSPMKYVDSGVAHAASAAWCVFERLTQAAECPSFTPAWSEIEVQIVERDGKVLNQLVEPETQLVQVSPRSNSISA